MSDEPRTPWSTTMDEMRSVTSGSNPKTANDTVAVRTDIPLIGENASDTTFKDSTRFDSQFLGSESKKKLKDMGYENTAAGSVAWRKLLMASARCAVYQSYREDIVQELEQITDTIKSYEEDHTLLSSLPDERRKRAIENIYTTLEEPYEADWVKFTDIGKTLKEEYSEALDEWLSNAGIKEYLNPQEMGPEDILDLKDEPTSKAVGEICDPQGHEKSIASTQLGVIAMIAANRGLTDSSRIERMNCDIDKKYVGLERSEKMAAQSIAKCLLKAYGKEDQLRQTLQSEISVLSEAYTD